ncbi:MAG: Gfo/Idh/MocA family oxidoreductase [Bryobacteraceae bacterium]|jgi:predicted dehydrogenase
MESNDASSVTRRSFLKSSALAGAATPAFSIVKPEQVHGVGKAMLKLGVLGVGMRGSQAVLDTWAGNENVRLVAIGELFRDRLEGGIANLKQKAPQQFEKKFKVDPEHMFIGFDAYRKVLATDIDIIMICTPPAYHPMHFIAAVEARKHIFCEKPFGTDPVNVRKLMAAAKKAEELKLVVVSGAQRHSHRQYLETIRKIHDGAIGEIVAAYANWAVNSGAILHLRRDVSPELKGAAVRDPKWTDMEFQHRNWYEFIWICGDQVVEQNFHNLDVINWVMGTHPVSAVASGGVAWRPRTEVYGNIYDHNVCDFEYPNGVHMMSHGRQYPPSTRHHDVSELVVGAKGRSNCHDMSNVRVEDTDFAQGEQSPYVQEHIDLVDSVLGQRPYINQGIRIAESTLTGILAREAAYSGMKITWDMIMKSQQDLFPKVLDMNAKIETPPVPVPGQYKFI